MPKPSVVAERRRRYYLAVRPALLQGALAQFLRAMGAEVVELDDDAVIDLRDRGFDVVVSTPGVRGTHEARLVIELPDDEGGAGTARVHVEGETHVIDVGGIDDVIDLIERHSTPPGTAPG